jgi:Domain of unknown function (DUF4279)
MHRYLVELNIAGDSIEEQEVSRLLGRPATRFFAKGQRRSPTSVWEWSIWSFEVLPPDARDWASLEDGLTCLLQELMPSKEAVAELAIICEVSVYCGHFYSSFGGGPTLSPKVLGLLAQFGVKLSISNYWSEEEFAEENLSIPQKSVAVKLR